MSTFNLIQYGTKNCGEVDSSKKKNCGEVGKTMFGIPCIQSVGLTQEVIVWVNIIPAFRLVVAIWQQHFIYV